MTNALTSVSNIRLSQSRAIERFRPTHSSTDEPASARTARRVDPSRATHPTASRAHPAYIAAFVAQAIANDNGPHATPYDAARTYWDMNYALADLPVGFLISRSV
jgi:hypothetical protein